MSVFAQYVPIQIFIRQTWPGNGTIAAPHQAISPSPPSAATAANLPDAVLKMRRSSAHPTSKKKVGLTGGHIFQGECLPANTCGATASPPRTPMPGVYLCGACTHPGGSVIGINGRNAAMAVLKDLQTH